MDYDELFTAYWTQYRGDSDVPNSSDPEYTIGLRLANEAINHWETYDGTYWRELFASFKDEEGTTISTGVIDYDCPDTFKEAGGHIRILDSNNKTVQTYPLIEPHEAQFKSDNATYAYFFGNPVDGYQLRVNPAPTSALNGKSIDYVFYKAATTFTTGTDVTEMANPYFIVHRMLANRFRATRNPYYTDALRDSENILGKMKIDNDSGTWANPWSVTDRSGSAWGA